MEVQTIGTVEPRTQSNEIEKQEGNGLSTNTETKLKSLYSYYKDNASVGLVVATFVDTVTFAAIFTTPYKKAGTTSIQKLAFCIFVTSNSLAFVFSVVAHEYPILASVATGIACLFFVGHAIGITILSGFLGYFFVY